MKKFNKLLLSSSALVGAAFLANIANAGTVYVKDDLQVKLSGFVAFQAGIYDDGDTVYVGSVPANKSFSNDHDFRTKVEVELAGRNKADWGLEYGFQIRLENKAVSEASPEYAAKESFMRLKEAKVWVEADFGHIDFGDDHGPIQKMDYRAPTVGIGQIDGDFDSFAGPFSRGQIGLHALNSERSTKIAYYTPRWNFFDHNDNNGLMLGVSYAPEFESRGRNVTRSDFADITTVGTGNLQLALNGNQQHWLEIGANYIQDIGPVQARVYGGYSHADAKDRINNTATDGNYEDVKSWQVGGQLAYAGFTLGGGYVDADDSGQLKTSKTEKTAWNIGLTYENGPWGFGVSYLDEDLGKTGKAVAGGDFHLFGAGVNYVVAPGLSVAADIGYFEREFKEVITTTVIDERMNPTKKKNDGWVAILQTRVDF